MKNLLLLTEPPYDVLDEDSMAYHFTHIGIVILLAALAAVFSSKLKQQPFIGYVLAGVIMGPSVLGILDNEESIRFFAETGVVLLLFLLGMELPLRTFRAIYKRALSLTFGIVFLSFAFTFAVGTFVDFTMKETIVYGFIMSLSSTAVAVKLLDSVDMLDNVTGQLAISILIAQDLLFIPMIMTINAMGASTDGFNIYLLSKIAVAILLLVGLVLFLSKRERIHLIFEKSVERHSDLIPVAALAWCFVGAGISEWAGMTPAYGAFLAGLVIGNSHSKDKVLPRIETMQSVFIMVFFLSIGLLIDTEIIMENFSLIMVLLFGTLVFKTVVCISLLRFFMPQEHWGRTFIAGLTISQIGEFSFIIAATALDNGILQNESYKIIIAIIALNLAVSPIWMAVAKRFVQVSYVDKTAPTFMDALRQTIAKILE